tara:strand:+ start:276 stop:503 length:228 start_codon:yes stop_codon:yes gene_type:complete
MPFTPQEVIKHAKKILKLEKNLRKSLKWEIKEMANGSKLNGARQKYYPNKPNLYFESVLHLIEKGELNEKNKRQQ